MEAQKGNSSSYVSAITNTMASSVSSLWNYFGGGSGKAPKLIEKTEEDLQIERQQNFLQIQHKKLEEIFNCLHDTFDNRQKQSVALREMSEIFNSLSKSLNQNSMNK
jgi:hypothetical protein